jgi:hypothetical protein
MTQQHYNIISLYMHTHNIWMHVCGISSTDSLMWVSVLLHTEQQVR